jgi:hypothetical protein
MAINVNEVYQTVLFILNKEQRGYLTPAEYNKIGTQVQLEIFEKYFEDLNQQLRAPETDSEYADRIRTIEDNIQIFETREQLTFANGAFTAVGIPEIHRLGTIQFEPDGINPTELQQVTQREYLELQRSPIIKPTRKFPIVVRRSGSFLVYPTDITSDIIAYYIKKPSDIFWGYGIGAQGQYIYDPQASNNFELSSIEQTEVILRILAYAGLVIRDPQIVQAAAQMVGAEDMNEKT